MDWGGILQYGQFLLTDIQPNLKPIFKIVVDGVEISSKINNRLESLSIKETRGISADQLDIVLSDHDGKLAIPPKGAMISVYMGFKPSSMLTQYFDLMGLVFKGTYKIDEVTHSGSPDKLSIKGLSADLTDNFAEAKEKSFHKKTVYQIVEEIALAHKLEYKISGQFHDEIVAHIDQTTESDASFLTRLAEQYDAIAAIKNGLLLFLDAGECVTASGAPIAPVIITRMSGDGHTYTTADTDNYSAVRAYYNDSKSGKKQEVVIDASNLEPKPKPKPQKKKGKGRPAGSADPSAKLESGAKVKTLRHIYAGRQSAMSGARTAFKKLKRGVAQFDINLAVGRPELFPQTPVSVKGFKAQIDIESWLIAEIEHRLDGNGITSSLKLEARLQLDDEPEQVEPDTDESSQK